MTETAPSTTVTATPGSYSYSSQFGAEGTGNGQFVGPAGMANDGKGNLWVVDHTNARVEEFAEDGTVRESFGSAGSGNGQFFGPSALAIDSKGNVWVADTNNSRIDEFNAKGEFEKAFGSHGVEAGTFRFPKGLRSARRAISGWRTVSASKSSRSKAAI